MWPTAVALEADGGAAGECRVRARVAGGGERARGGMDEVKEGLE